MAYTKTNWLDRQVTYPMRYQLNLVTGTTYDLVSAEGTIVQGGTPLNATNLNNMENGIANNDSRITTLESTVPNKLDKSGGTLTGTLTGTTINATTLQEGGTNLASKYLSLGGGTLTGTLTGTTINATTLQEGGTALSSKYAQIANFYDKTTADGRFLPKTSSANITVTAGSYVFTFQNDSGFNAPVMIEGGTRLDNKYLKLAGGTMTGQLVVSKNGSNVAIKGTATGTTNVADIVFQDSAGSEQGRIGKMINGNSDIYLKNNVSGGKVSLQTYSGQVDLDTSGNLTVSGILNAPTIQEGGTALQSKYKKLPLVANGTTLWSGSATMTLTTGITPSSPLSACENGWLLAWGSSTGGNITYTQIPKDVKLDDWCFLSMPSAGGWATASMVVKLLHPNSDGSLGGHVDNGSTTNSSRYLLWIKSY
jgi:hypothetical protein